MDMHASTINKMQRFDLNFCFSKKSHWSLFHLFHVFRVLYFKQIILRKNMLLLDLFWIFLNSFIECQENVCRKFCHVRRFKFSFCYHWTKRLMRSVLRVAFKSWKHSILLKHDNAHKNFPITYTHMSDPYDTASLFTSVLHTCAQ